MQPSKVLTAAPKRKVSKIELKQFHCESNSKHDFHLCAANKLNAAKKYSKDAEGIYKYPKKLFCIHWKIPKISPKRSQNLCVDFQYMLTTYL